MADEFEERAERMRSREWHTAGPVLLMTLGVYLLVVYVILVAFALPLTGAITGIILGTGLLSLVAGFAWGARQRLPGFTRRE